MDSLIDVGVGPVLYDKLHRSLDQATSAVGQPKTIVWDVRSLEEFEGTASGYGPPVRLGRNPGAVHLDWTELFGRDMQTLKPTKELQDLLASRGIALDREIDTY